jgi:hypothetical protein
LTLNTIEIHLERKNIIIIITRTSWNQNRY